MSISIAACMVSDAEALPAVRRWECAGKRRYYMACVQRNLFGELEVWRVWGATGSARGGQRIDPVADLDAAHEQVSLIEKRRRARGDIDPHDVDDERRHQVGCKVGAFEPTPCGSMATNAHEHPVVRSRLGQQPAGPGIGAGLSAAIVAWGPRHWAR